MAFTAFIRVYKTSSGIFHTWVVAENFSATCERIGSDFTLSNENMNDSTDTSSPEGRPFGQSQPNENTRPNSMAAQNSSMVPRRISSENIKSLPNITPVPPPGEVESIINHQGRSLRQATNRPSQPESASPYQIARASSAEPNPSIDLHDCEKEASIKDILRVAVLIPVKARSDTLPDHFNKYGQLMDPYRKRYGAEVKRAQEQACNARRKMKPKKAAEQRNLVEVVIHEMQTDKSTLEAPASDSLPEDTRCTKCHSGFVRKKGSTCQLCRVKKSQGSSGTRKQNATPQPDDSSKISGFALADAFLGEDSMEHESELKECGKVRTLLPSAPRAENLKSPSESLPTVDGSALEDELAPQLGESGIESTAKHSVREKSMALVMPVHTPEDEVIATSIVHARVQQRLSMIESERSSSSKATNNFNSQAPGRNISEPSSPSQKQPDIVEASSDIADNRNWKRTGNTPPPLTTIPKFGKSQLDDDEIHQMLDQLSALLLQYTSNACAKPWPSLIPTTFLDIPCIREEPLVDALSPDGPLLTGMRRLLDVPNGISVKSKIKSLQIEPEKSMWIGGVLTFLVKEFVFTSASPFDDTTVWAEGLTYIGYSPEAIETIIQDNRIRTISSPSKSFSNRLATRQESFIRELNATMMPLVGCNSETNNFHTAVAALACSFNTQLSAHTGVFEAIFPKTGDLFEYGRHELDGSETDGKMRDARELVGRPILLTALFGVKAKMGGREWRTCVAAKVRLWPVAAAIVAGQEVANCGDGCNKDSSLGAKSQKRSFIDISEDTSEDL
ncbi:hypothetical protein VTL71DRAFT_15080 [Oculimacula yallundae]|uniref:Uncharacterized protein n=1 Tax=Oculimacula yallundae TaxID=86028 RepID=A0ABR4CGB0_9HELO